MEIGFASYPSFQPIFICSKLANENTRTIREISSKLIDIADVITTHWHRSYIFIINFKQISHIVLVFVLLTLNMIYIYMYNAIYMYVFMYIVYIIYIQYIILYRIIYYRYIMYMYIYICIHIYVMYMHVCVNENKWLGYL